MKIIKQSPKKSLNKAFLKQRPLRSEIELFKKNLIRLLDHVDEIEREENQKNHIRDFLRDTFYKDTNEVNTKDTKDLVIHLGKTNKDKVGVIIEAKRPGNKNEMISEPKPNSKAFQELVLYYLRERIEENNIDIKYLIITNVYEWYIFDASWFEKLFYRNKSFVKEYEQWRDGQKVTKDTSLFYSSIAQPFIDKIEEEIPCTWFDIRDYEKIIRNTEKDDDKSLIALQKLLSPYFLLKQSFANDSNTLNQNFYKELLHIIGLEEVKEGSKNIIRRKEKDRCEGSIIENTINILETENSLSKIKDKSAFGETRDEQIFSIALELSLNWIIRILFLKLLEGLLVSYHRGNKDFRFLNIENIQDFDELYKLFHQVLDRKVAERAPSVKQKYARVPYLNSSLFEISNLENLTIKINSLDDAGKLELLSTTVLKEEKKKNNTLPTLEYLFRFLEAYDFGSEGGEDIAEDNKTIINTSVLGKVFEKINGYKDGSIFTPGFITMYMSRQSLRLAVVQKFNEYFKTIDLPEVKDFTELYNRMDKVGIAKANEIINSLRTCDPAVGSGHFLVSMLNEFIVIKQELGILVDKTGKRLRGYEIVVENDELIISDENGIYEYNYHNKESQRVQETLFNEKQTIIENCLFGVDINPKSVMICRLRLWIELLKNAYYKNPSDNANSMNLPELETLPNIDINIKCGNSLISRYGLDADLKKALQKSKWNVQSYQLAVMTYRNSKSKDEKHEMQRLIDEIKNNFETEIQFTDRRNKKLAELRGDLTALTNQNNLFDKTEEQKAKWNKKVNEVAEALRKQEQLIEEIKNNVIYKNAFEWRFEFPEVLNDNGDFMGFDLVIGNPPYGVLYSENMKAHLKQNYEGVQQKMFDSFLFFISLGEKLIKSNAIKSFIVPNNLIYQMTFEKARMFLISNFYLYKVINLGDKVFKDAEVPTCIYIAIKNRVENYAINYIDLRDIEQKENFLRNGKFENILKSTLLNTYSLVFGVKGDHSIIIDKINNQSSKISEILENASYGIGSGGDKIFRINKKFSLENNFEKEILYPVYSGGNITRYFIDYQEDYIIYTTKDLNINNYPKVFNYLIPYETKLQQKRETIKGIIPWWCLHWPRNKELYIGDKIVLRQTGDKITGALNTNSYFVMDSVMVLKLKKGINLDLKYLLSLLNSKLYGFLYENISKEKGRAFAQVKPQNIKQLPIKSITSKEQESFIELVDKIMFLKQQNQTTTDLENQIDKLVYELYGLTEEEIRIVEESV